MPFNSDGTFTDVTGATTAAPGDVIRSSVWNAFNEDYATAFGQLGIQSWVATPRIITAPGAITASITDAVILVQANVPIINLPTSSTKQGPLRIMGAAAGAFGSNNCVVTPNGAQTISGLATVTLNANYQVIELFPFSTTGWIAR